MAGQRFSLRGERRLTPLDSMREFMGSTAFGTVMVFVLIFAFLHQRVISVELEHGTGGMWCSLGMPAVLCLTISSVLTFFGSKTKLLPALVPIIGLGGLGISVIMFFVIQIKRLNISGNVLGIVQELTMLVFLGAIFVCILLLMLTGVGMRVPSALGVPAAVAAVLAAALFVIRAMYTFSSLVTALSRNLLLPDNSMADEISWILRSVSAGGEEAVTLYYARLLDSVGIALLLVACVTFSTAFRGYFSEQASILKNMRDIPLPTRRRGYYAGYDEYTEDSGAADGGEFQMTRDGYYVEKKETSRAKFKRRERSEEDPASEQDANAPAQTGAEDQTADEEVGEEYVEEYYDDYIPGEGWDNFVQRKGPDPAEASQEQPTERIKVTPKQTDPPAPDPRDPELWNKYKK